MNEMHASWQWADSKSLFYLLPNAELKIYVEI